MSSPSTSIASQVRGVDEAGDPEGAIVASQAWSEESPDPMLSPSKRVGSRNETELACFQAISEALQRTSDMNEVLGPLFTALGEQLALRAAVAVYDPKTDEITIEAAAGLSEHQRERGRYHLGEGVTGRVVESGEAMVVPNTAKEPRFLNRTGAHSAKDMAPDCSFTCVPILLDGKVLGALSGTRAADTEEVLQQDLRFLTVAASIIAPAAHQWRREQLRRRAASAEQAADDFGDRFQPTNMIGTSKSMRGVYDLIEQVSQADATVLIRGESGVGKELVAEAIHRNSKRKDKAFVKVNCAALPTTVLHSELFGHERGAFTGAISQRKGRFELAHNGTIFLDEIGDISAETQVILLRILQEKEFERVGGTDTIRSDVRVIAATNRNLEKQIADGRFREDLYYRLNVFPIHAPPLRERKTDILLLADYFVGRYSKASNKTVRRITTSAIDMLMSYHWPGNVRELENCIERAVLLSQDDVIHGHHLPPSLQTGEASGTEPAGTLQATLDAVEREMIVEALKASRGKMAGAARRLGITERQMGLRIKKYGIECGRFQPGS